MLNEMIEAIDSLSSSYSALVQYECRRLVSWYSTLTVDQRDTVVAAAWDSAGLVGMERFLSKLWTLGYDETVSADWYDSSGNIFADWLTEG